MRGATREQDHGRPRGGISIHAPRAGCDFAFGHAIAQQPTFQSTHPVRGATRSAWTERSRWRNISIHAPRAGCDCIHRRDRMRGSDFNPRTPCGVRLRFRRSLQARRYFNPRTPCGVRQLLSRQFFSVSKFQSTHPVRGATSSSCGAAPVAGVFQSTHPVRGATRPSCAKTACACLISIHAPRAGCDRLVPFIRGERAISIHAPRAGCD